MKTLNKYLVYVEKEDGKVSSVPVVGASRSAVRREMEGKGEIVTIKPMDTRIIRAADIRAALEASEKLSALDIAWVMDALTKTGIVTTGIPAPLPAKPAIPAKKANLVKKPAAPKADKPSTPAAAPKAARGAQV